MIEPAMATMLAVIMTDAAAAPAALQAALSSSVSRSFNRISVDGDQSTNDTVLLLANGAAGNTALDEGHADAQAFRDALDQVTLDLALQILRDGEGARKLVTVHVSGARTAEDADTAARAVANSLLVKTSWAGNEANWGRVMDALGYSGADLHEERVDVSYDGVPAVERGVAAPTSAERLNAIVSGTEFTVGIRLGLGDGEAVVYTCDCTEEYVRINK
jgi:glutamate N-acetyltransferase/amino-acid N-acetyltransferase